jgi:hypothetical protein
LAKFVRTVACLLEESNVAASEPLNTIPLVLTVVVTVAAVA